MTRITPYLVGSGSAGKAMMKSLAMVKILEPDLAIEPVVVLKRGQPLGEAARAAAPLLLIANPHGLHAELLLEAKRVGISHVVVEKPACVTLSQASALENLGLTVAVCHGYRQMWGPRTLKTLLTDGKLGDLVAIEGRYWQSSSAAKALAPTDGGAKGFAAGGAATKKPSWKNDPRLNGPHDTLVDLGAHWVDLVLHLTGEEPESARAWLSYANAETDHRDTHVHLTMEWPRRRALASISKTWHGAGNQLEIHLLGTRGRASWEFLDPDRIELAVGGETRVLPRPDAAGAPSGQAPFHGLGWLEGYVDILRGMALTMAGQTAQTFPTLQENLRAMRWIFQAAGDF